MRRVLQEGECVKAGKYLQGYLFVLAEVVGSVPGELGKRLAACPCCEVSCMNFIACMMLLLKI